MDTVDITLPSVFGFHSEQLVQLLDNYSQIILGDIGCIIPGANYTRISMRQNTQMRDSISFVEKAINVRGRFCVRSPGISDAARLAFDMRRVIRHIRHTLILQKTPISERHYSVDEVPPFMTANRKYQPIIKDTALIEGDLQGIMTISTEMLEVMKDALAALISVYSGEFTKVIDIYRDNTESGSRMSSQEIIEYKNTLRPLNVLVKETPEWISGARIFERSLPAAP